MCTCNLSGTKEKMYGNVSVLTCDTMNGVKNCQRTDLGYIDVPWLNQKKIMNDYNLNSFELKDNYDLWRYKY
jgi:hypothetical protein